MSIHVVLELPAAVVLLVMASGTARCLLHAAGYELASSPLSTLLTGSMNAFLAPLSSLLSLQVCAWLAAVHVVPEPHALQ
jgi:hypothetical protein